MRRAMEAAGRRVAAGVLLLVSMAVPVHAQLPAPQLLAPVFTVASLVQESRNTTSPHTSWSRRIMGSVTPAFSVAPRTIFRRRGPRGAMVDYSRQTVWLSASVHELLPRDAQRYWPAPVRLSMGRRALGAGMPAEYVLGLDLDAAKLPGSHPLWVHTKRVLHTLRLPGPAIVMGPRGTRALGLYW